MKKIGSIILILIMAIGLTACGGADNSDDPNVGMWNAVSASMLGISSGIDEIFEQGASLELKGNGKYELILDGEADKGKWTYEEDGLAFSGSQLDLYGRIEDGILTLENIMDTGLDLAFQK